MTSIATGTRQLDGDALQALQAGITGTVITPGHPDYEVARQIVSLAFDRRPAAIVRAEGTEDVAFAVRFARQHDLEIAPRSGAHSVYGYSSVDDALVIDLGGMVGITIDPIEHVATVQAGVTSARLAGPALQYGLSLSTGDTGTVGIGGLTVGGGIGWMARKYGLTIDNLLSATVVTASGEVVRTSKTEHPDLFWAIRGGGGNFGIITDFTFRLAPSGMVHGGAVVLPATREVLRGYLDYTPKAPEELTTIAFLMAAPPAPFIPEDVVGRPVLLVGLTWAGPIEDVDAANEAIAPLRALAAPIADTVGPIPYDAMFAYTAEAEKRHGATIRSLFGDELTDAQLDAILEAMGRSTSPFNMVQFRGMGGAVSRVPVEETAFVNRDSDFMVAVIGIWMDPADDGEAHRRWTLDLWKHLEPASKGAYVNFLQDDGEARLPLAYREAMTRLREVKTKYDPDNVFHHNQNIRPAAPPPEA